MLYKLCKKTSIAVVTIVLASLSFASIAKEHPSLILTKAGVEEIRSNLGKVPLFDSTIEKVKKQVDKEIAMGIDTPIPVDFSGGYTHYRHKQNFIIAQQAGALYQILEDEKYARYVKDMLFQYEAMYKNLPVHPQVRSYAPGKLFWQCLNDSNWLVYMSQAYDTIHDYLSEQERNTLETSLFRPFADYISLANPAFYNRVHNHSTWGNAAVGMIGLVMDDEELIQRALYGIENDGLAIGGVDNDGGTIKSVDQKRGFLANLEQPFSPDGYYTEGPYYQRYAMYPFLIFATAMNNTKPEHKVFEHKDNVLLKGVDALLNLSDADGDFFPLNDGQKGMSYFTPSLVTAINIAYYYDQRTDKKNNALLSVAQKQNEVLLDQTGLAVAKAIYAGEAEPFAKQSVNLSDGANGDEGGVAVLRSGSEDLTAVFKYAAQGLSHGHYDKLSYSLYQRGEEVVQDYGLVRFVNIGQKGGGNYLKENTTWAKSTIAHNTLSQDQQIHFGGDYKTGSQYHSDLHFYADHNPSVQVASAKESNAYPGTQMHRTIALIANDEFSEPLMLDIMRVEAQKKHDYDLPLYYFGQIIQSNIDYTKANELRALGDKNGYQHLYLEAQGSPTENTTQFSWLNEGKFFTLSTLTSDTDEVLLTRIGANDPEFNLRNEPGFMLRRKSTQNTLFVSLIEQHGTYDPVTELSLNSNSRVKSIDVLHDSGEYTALQITDKENKVQVFIVANQEGKKSAKHSLTLNGKVFTWTGPYYYRS